MLVRNRAADPDTAAGRGNAFDRTNSDLGVRSDSAALFDYSGSRLDFSE